MKNENNNKNIIDFENILPNNNEIMYYYNDIQSIILIKEEIKNM